MAVIHVLPNELCNKIAAGEVVERPASVVKELIENSIDAETSEIRVEIVHGGKKVIRVSDNGIGMGRDDAELCFMRHATSKISDYDDLFRIRTMGFRGEALPSIASVSKIRLNTAERGAQSGISIYLEGGEIKEIKDAPSAGTSIEIKDLFYNTPARKKFLKTDNTELFHIIDIVTKEALSHPEIGFILLTDNKETMNLPKAAGMRERIMQIYGEELLQGLNEVSSANMGMQIQAFISKSSNFRSTRSHQHLFINRRPVKDQSISHAIYKAYEGILPHDKHPVFFLFLELPPNTIDFNVHPAKREVRFADKESIYRSVLSSLRDDIKKERTEYTREFSDAPVAAEAYPYQGQSIYCSTSETTSTAVSEKPEFSYSPQQPFIYLGETFIALAGRGGLTVIDHHAAHERILFERLLSGIDLMPRQLLFPKQVQLTGKEHAVLLQNRDIVLTFGIEVDDFGGNTVVVRSIPDALHDVDIQGILSDIASGLIEGTASNKSIREELAARIACHSSIRGEKILSQQELSSLLSDLEKTERPDQCPHGRPTRIFYSLNDLNKLFKRR